MLGRKPVTQARITELLRQHHLLSAPQILDKMSSEGHPVNKTSVYRALDKMLAAEIICKQVFADDVLLYELRDNHHDHLVCENCGKIEAAECHTAPNFSQTGFSIRHHHMTLFGYCADCSSAN